MSHIYAGKQQQIDHLNGQNLTIYSKEPYSNSLCATTCLYVFKGVSDDLFMSWNISFMLLQSRVKSNSY